jgi:Mg-chelatase subunit ChlI
MKLALQLLLIDPVIGGVLICGGKGTAKSMAVRALHGLLPELPLVTLPLDATEEMLLGGLDWGTAFQTGARRLQPGLLARAHGGILYVAEVNLLHDYLVDMILDAVAGDRQVVEREGVSASHAARVALVGTMNPEEGDLRPELLDRFGLCVTVAGISGTDERVEIMERRLAYAADPVAFARQWAAGSQRLREQIAAAIALHPQVTAEHAHLRAIAAQCQELGVDGHRADIITLKTAKALAARHGRTQAEADDVRAASELALSHRMRRLPFEAVGEVRRCSLC